VLQPSALTRQRHLSNLLIESNFVNNLLIETTTKTLKPLLLKTTFNFVFKRNFMVYYFLGQVLKSFLAFGSSGRIDGVVF